MARIVDKCLEKDRNLRYQHASEIRSDLQRLKRDSDSGRAADRRGAGSGEGHRDAPLAGCRCCAAAAMAALAAGYAYVHRPPQLTDKDTIVLADFTNTTGDPVFDGTLRQGLAIQLEQSPFLSLVSDEVIQKTLGLMGQKADARADPKLAREICERTGRCCRSGRLDCQPSEASTSLGYAQRTAAPETSLMRSRCRRPRKKTS